MTERGLIKYKPYNREPSVDILEESMIGRCREMCPRKEAILREKQRRLHFFEILPGTEKSNRPKYDPLATIKEYSRPAAGKQVSAEELRPMDVLVKTMDYMVTRILSRTDVPWTKVYHFVFDRCRSIRQDMVIQRLAGPESVGILQQLVCFHIYSSYRLSGEPMSVYDPAINNQHLQECLKRLLVLYQSLPANTIPMRAQFEALCILYNLGSYEALYHALSLPHSIRNLPAIQHSLKISRSFLENNYVKFYRLAKHCTYTQLCALHRHLAPINRAAIKLLCVGYSSKNSRFPLSILQGWLCLESQSQAQQLCVHYGVTVEDGVALLHKNSFLTDRQPMIPRSSLINIKPYQSCSILNIEGSSEVL